MKIPTLFLKDFYKVDHISQYPKGTELIFYNFTPRKSMLPEIEGSVFFGLKYFIDEYLKDGKWIGEFFEYEKIIKQTLGHDKFDHLIELTSRKTLPIAIYALDEGTFVPSGVPALVMYNTDPDFFWLPGILETILSCTLWGACTSATMAREYRIMLDAFAHDTSDIPEFVDYQAHDFSFRGMFGLEAAILSGMAHLQYFKGTDTLPAVVANNYYYGKEYELCSVSATEHSVMSSGGKENEFETFKRLITEIYPSGIISIVSDTWDLWNVVDNFLPKLKNIIMARDGKVVIRPDSGDPIQIISTLIPKLWEIFGGTINSKGYKQLDPHIGAIYGDSITPERAKAICQNLKAMGFASTNIVFGIGSYTYQYVTRDTFGWAMKATYCEINGKEYAITKDPITDCGTKKSHSGLLAVFESSGGNLTVQENCSWHEFKHHDNQLKLVYLNGDI